MAGTSPVIRPAGKTAALSVVATSHAAVTLDTSIDSDAAYAACLNPGSVAVAIQFSQNGVAAVFPIDGTSTGSFVLPPLMEAPVILPIPLTLAPPSGTTGNASAVGPQVTAIGAAAGPTIIYVTAITYQS